LVFFAARDGGAARENRKNGRQEILRSSQDGRKKNQARGSCISGEAKRCPSAIFVKILAFAFAGGGGAAARGNSRRFLATAMAPLGDESDGEDEGSIMSRTSRLRVVQLMGGSFERVTGAVFAVH
jgi:hypothetical protein